LKGRCIGVSLFSYLSVFLNNYMKKNSLPGVSKYQDRFPKRKEKEAPLYTCRKGSLTVEAAILLPLLAGFFVCLLFYFQVMEVQLMVQNALQETGRSLAILAVKELEEPQEDIEYPLLAKGMLLFKLQDCQTIKKYVVGGAAGVSLLTSEYDEDYILLNAKYVMTFPIKLFGRQDFLLCQKVKFRKWNGWESMIKNPESSLLVYVTEYGEVYHLRRSCTHLALTIEEIPVTELAEKRNASGECYEPCEYCAEKTSQVGKVYITEYGDKYHMIIGCQGLKRTIYQKRFSEVGGMPACTKCVNKENK